METLFGKAVETIGSNSANLILKTRGELKVQWGNKYIDLIKDGKIASSSNTSDLFKTVSSEDEVEGTGIFINPENGEIWVSVQDTKIAIGNQDSKYISFLQKQDISANDKEVALSNIGFYYNSIDDVKAAQITSGLVYVKSEKCLYLIDSGIVTKYDVNSEEVEASSSVEEILKAGTITISSNKINSNGELNITVNEQPYLQLTANRIIVLKSVSVNDGVYIQSKNASEDSGYRLYNNTKSTLEIDNIIWRNQEQQLNKYVDGLSIFSNCTNVIVDIISEAAVQEETPEIISEETPEEQPEEEPENAQVTDTIMQCKLQYANNFNIGDFVYIQFRDSEEFQTIIVTHEQKDSNIVITISTEDGSLLKEDVIINVTYNETLSKEITLLKDTSEFKFEETLESFTLNNIEIISGYEGLITNAITDITTKTVLKTFEVVDSVNNNISILVYSKDYNLAKNKLKNSFVYKANSPLLTIEGNNINVVENSKKHSVIGDIQNIVEPEEINPSLGIFSDNLISSNATFKTRYPKYDDALQAPAENFIDSSYDQSIPNIGWVKNLIQSAIASIIPPGTIVRWHDVNPIPEGWVKCDGSNKTPRLGGYEISVMDGDGDTNHVIFIMKT